MLAKQTFEGFKFQWKLGETTWKRNKMAAEPGNWRPIADDNLVASCLSCLQREKDPGSRSAKMIEADHNYTRMITDGGDPYRWEVFLTNISLKVQRFFCGTSPLTSKK